MSDDTLQDTTAVGVERLPLRTPTLLPATHTNSYFVGRRDFYLVEPSSPYGPEQARLHDFIEARIERGHRLLGVIATHHHPDHVGGAGAVCERFGVPLMAHARTRDKLAGRVTVHRLLDESDTGLGDPVGLDLAVLHTPGHAPGHLCLHERTAGWMIVGDMLSSLSTIVIDPDDDGDMDDYIAQLRRMASLGPTTLLPAHGDPVADGAAALGAYVAHREAREEKVRRAVGGGADTLAAVVARAYEEAPVWLWPIAAKSARAHLERLRRRGEITMTGDKTTARWRPTEDKT
ncbi:MAG: MBL fold metallo-hydrolase [Deltaproteobacteria bacterium]|nr:MBL fold metallo-hydrolase [Myxococcales bacterium]MDP3219477.1 MBL fold metallo-hydrolase [Deltaproteobacteria bacterium]